MHVKESYYHPTLNKNYGNKQMWWGSVHTHKLRKLLISTRINVAIQASMWRNISYMYYILDAIYYAKHLNTGTSEAAFRQLSTHLWNLISSTGCGPNANEGRNEDRCYNGPFSTAITRMWLFCKSGFGGGQQLQLNVFRLSRNPYSIVFFLSSSAFVQTMCERFTQLIVQGVCFLLAFVALLYDFPRLSYASTKFTSSLQNYLHPLPERFSISKKVCYLLFESSDCRLKWSMACNWYTVTSEVLHTASISPNKAYEIDCKPYTTLMTVYQLQAMLHLSLHSPDSKRRRQTFVETRNLCDDRGRSF